MKHFANEVKTAKPTLEMYFRNDKTNANSVLIKMRKRRKFYLSIAPFF